jgi:hypothetical protein
MGTGANISSAVNQLIITIDGNKTVAVIFTQDHYIVSTSVSSSPYGVSGYITKSPEKPTYTYDDIIQVTATPASGYELCFMWISGGNSSIIYGPSTINLVVHDSMSIFAYFERVPSSQVSLTVMSTVGGYVIGSSNGLYNRSDEIQLTAVPDNGYIFAGWSMSRDEDSSSNPLAFSITQNMVIVANFYPEMQTVLKLSPQTIIGPKPDVGDNFEVNLQIENVSRFWAWGADLQWNPEVLELVEVSEGPFLNFDDQNSFPFTPSYNGFLDNMCCTLMSFNSASGTGVLATFTFRVLNYGASEIQLSDTMLYIEPFMTNPPNVDSSRTLTIPHTVAGAAFSLNPPPSGGPTAKFTLPNNGNCYVGDLVILDASNSLLGYDTLPVGHATSNSITLYTWSIDIYNDGTIDMVLEGENVSAVIPNVCETSITLTVTAPDSYLPTDPNYQQTNSVTKLLHVQQRPTKANLDVYTQLGDNLLTSQVTLMLHSSLWSFMISYL